MVPTCELQNFTPRVMGLLVLLMGVAGTRLLNMLTVDCARAVPPVSKASGSRMINNCRNRTGRFAEIGSVVSERRLVGAVTGRSNGIRETSAQATRRTILPLPRWVLTVHPQAFKAY